VLSRGIEIFAAACGSNIPAYRPEHRHGNRA
jgi:hypothetical protein